MKVAFFILLWILSIVILFAWIGTVNFMNKIDSLTEENKMLKSDNKKLNEKIKVIEAEKDEKNRREKKHLDNFYSYDGTKQE